MADEAKPEHYSEKYKREIEALKSEVARLTTALEAASTATVVGPATPAPARVAADPNLFAAAFIAGHEALGGGGDIVSLLKTRWRAAAEFIDWVAAGADKAMFAEQDALERRLAEKAAKDAADIIAAEVARKAAAQAAYAAK